RLLGLAQAAGERLPIKLGRERLQAQAGGHIAALTGGLAPVAQVEAGGKMLSPRCWHTPPAPALPRTLAVASP
ncbi:MAG: hypothetical protein NT167_16900, partial [Verrucomicrobia bacterium]|nr:hypothetical protein [Verrucomicrobiota bacterium]